MFVKNVDSINLFYRNGWISLCRKYNRNVYFSSWEEKFVWMHASSDLQENHKRIHSQQIYQSNQIRNHWFYHKGFPLLDAKMYKRKCFSNIFCSCQVNERLYLFELYISLDLDRFMLNLNFKVILFTTNRVWCKLLSLYIHRLCSCLLHTNMSK